MKKVVLVTAGEERLPAGTAEAIRQFADFRAKRCETPAELLATFPDADVCWMFGPNLCLKPEALEKMPNVKALLRSGSGLDALPCDWAKEHGIGVYNTPESIAESVAEHAVALLISYIRQVPQYNMRAKAGYAWGKVEGMDWHISHRTLGLIGYGNIARRVEKMMSGFDMTTIHYDPFVPGSLPLEEVLKRSDYVSVHCPLTPETKGLINAERLALMKPNAILVNTSRGPVVDEEALADALDAGKLGGAAIDVMCAEPPDVKSRLLQHPKCLVTPHVAAFSCDFEKNFFAASVEKLRQICTTCLALAALCITCLTAQAAPTGRLGDNVWMWGHDTGHYDGPVNYAHNDYKIPASMPIAMADACQELGATHCCVIRPGMPPPPDGYNEQFKKLDSISWLLWRSTRDYCIKTASKIPNIQAFDLDDFFAGRLMVDEHPDTGERIVTMQGAMTLKEIADMRRQLNNAAGHHVDLRLVLYVHQLNPYIIPACEAMDKILLWTWEGKDVTSMGANVRRFRELLPTKPIILGLYMWDFGGHRPLKRDFMESQLDLAARLYAEGVIEGVIFHCTPLVNKNLEAVAMAKAWIAEHKDDRPGVRKPTPLAERPRAQRKPDYPMRSLSFDMPKTWECPELSRDGLRALWIEGTGVKGKMTRAFAYLALPEGASADRKVPGIVLAHGGAGTAYPTWAKTWAKKGYAAIVVDTCGQLPIRDDFEQRWISSGIGGPSGWGRFELGCENVSDQWPYVAVDALVRAHTLLRAQPEVDAEKTGITGISWGGVLTVLAAASDNRFKFAMPVYACGYFDEMYRKHGWFKDRALATADQLKCWDALFDPIHYAPKLDLPVFWFASSSDVAFPFEFLQRTISLPKKMPGLAVRVGMKHSHGPNGENMPELFRFADHIVKGAPALPTLGMPTVRDGHISVSVTANGNALKRFELNWCAVAAPNAADAWHVERLAVPSGDVFSTRIPKGAKCLYVNAILVGETGETIYPEMVVSSPAITLAQ